MAVVFTNLMQSGRTLSVGRTVQYNTNTKYTKDLPQTGDLWQKKLGNIYFQHDREKNKLNWHKEPTIT